MTPEQWDRVKEVFSTALKTSPQGRAEFLIEACGKDEALLAEANRLLAAHDSAGGFLSSPVWKNNAAQIPDIAFDQQAADSSTVTTDLRGALPRAGDIFAGRYEIKTELGRGGFGIVYSALDRGPLQRTVALKVIRLTQGASPDATARQRFLEEARVAGNLSHNNIATVFDVAEFDGCIYMTQELAPGRDLRKILNESGLLPLRRIIAIARQTCEGLAHAHAHNIVHRDIKPGNIVIGTEDRVKVTDFGLAQPPQSGDSALAQAVAGTPGYMAPEQLRGERVDGRADIFALGCVLYQMLTGRQPFEGSTAASVIEKTLNILPLDPSRVREDLPRTLDRIVGRAMRKNPADRYDNITQLQQDLLNYEQFEYLTDSKMAASEIATALEARQCTIFVGLHLPINVDEKRADTAERLIADYLAERLYSLPKERGLSRLAQELETERGRPEMIKYLTAAVRNPRVSPRDIIRRVARLPFPVIVTTSYDTFLEEELTKLNRKVRRVINCRNVPDDPAGADLLVRLFGSVDSEASVVVTEDDLWNFFGSFHSLSDALKSLFARHRLLFVGYDPEDEGFRHLFSEIGRFRVGTTEGCYLVARDAVLPTVRWAQRKALRLIDSEPATFLSLMEETITERRRQKRASKEELPEAPLPSRPYKFLNYYDRDDERIFFGRQDEMHRLLTKIHAYPLNILYAASGSGKTSLICAGLMPQLRRQGYTPVYCRVYDDPIAEIRRAALESAGTPTVDFPTAKPLHSLLSELAESSDQRLVIFVDQFEEMFIRHDHEARDRFAAALAATLVESKGRVRFVLSLREDFLPRLSEFRERIPNIFHNELRLAPLTERDSRAAIVEPARLLGLEVEDALVDRLIQDLSRDGVDPPQLQIVCDTLYDALPLGERHLTLKSYLALGETRKILGNYLERVLREFQAPERETAREVLKSLVTSEKTKTVTRIGDLTRAAGRSEEEVSRILADLSNRRLIRRVQRDEGYWYELTHEYLVEEISRWLSEKEMQLKKLRELLEQAIRNHRNLGILMPAAQLRLVQAQEDDLSLSKEERQFLRESAQAFSTRRKRIIAYATAALISLAIASVSGRYVYLRNHIYIRSDDREFIETSYGRRISHRIEDIRVHSGTPRRWWIDSPLGFPKQLYQTDFALPQIDPGQRDALKDGISFPRHTQPLNEILGLLTSDERVMLLLTSGKPSDAIKLLPTVYKDPSVDKSRLDDLAAVLAYSGISDSALLEPTLRFGLENRQGFSVATVGDIGLMFDSHAVALSPLFASFPVPVRRLLLAQYLTLPITHKKALQELALAGTKDDMDLVLPDLENEEAGNPMEPAPQAIAIVALAGMGDCSLMSRVNRIVLAPRSPVSTSLAALRYLNNCGVRPDPRMVRSIVQGQLDSPFGGALETLNFFRWSGGPEAIPAIRSTLAAVAKDSSLLRALEYSMDSRASAEFQTALTSKQANFRSMGASLLAELGDRTGLETAAVIVGNESAHDTEARAQALEAFQWFKGAGIRRLLLNAVRKPPDLDARISAQAIKALRWYDDDETVDTIFRLLSQSDTAARNAARDSLAWGSERSHAKLRKEIDKMDPISKVYCARAMQVSGNGGYENIFQRYLEKEDDNLKDYGARGQAIVGLRDTYIAKTTPIVLEALKSPYQTVRFAAILALAEGHRNDSTAEQLATMSQNNDPVLQYAANRARSLMDASERVSALTNKAQGAVLGGDLQLASKILDQLTPSREPLNAFYRAMAAHELSDSFLSRMMQEIAPRMDATRLLRCHIAVRRGDIKSAMDQLANILNEAPWFRKTAREDSELTPLHEIYAFRVLTGMQEPTTVESIDLPNPGQPNSKPSAPKTN
jgi:hypothetical protein